MKHNLYALYKMMQFTLSYSKQGSLPGKKTTYAVWLDLLRWFMRSGTYCSQYLLWGLDAKGKVIGDYISKNETYKVIDFGARLLQKRLRLRTTGYEAICQDKQVSASYLSSHNIQCIDTLDTIVSGKSLLHGGNTQDCLMRQARIKRILLKAVSEDSSNGVFFAECVNSQLIITDIQGAHHDPREVVRNGVWLVQPHIESHSVLKEFCDSVLHTTRIVTINNGEDIIFMGVYQAFGTTESKTDSWDHGAVYVGVNPQSQILEGSGYRLTSKLGCYKKMDIHPDSKKVFNSVQIPYIQDAIKLCIDAHRFLYGVFIVGWDIAITDKGPVIVEANNRPGLNAFQLFNSQFKKDLDAIIRRLEIDNQYK